MNEPLLEISEVQNNDYYDDVALPSSVLDTDSTKKQRVGSDKKKGKTKTDVQQRLIERMIILEEDGWKNIAETPLKESITDIPAALKSPATNPVLTPLDAVKLFFTQNFINQLILIPLNESLMRKRETVSINGRKRYNRLDLVTFWRFLGYYLMQMILDGGLLDDPFGYNGSLRDGFMGINRWKAIHSCFDFSEDHLKAIVGHLRERVSSLFNLGTTSVVGQYLSDYRGRDAKDKGVLLSVEQKSHKPGILTYYLVQYLTSSSLPLIVDLEPRLSSNKVSPQEAILNLVSRVKTLIPSSHHVVADGLFYASEAFELQGHSFTIGMNSSSICKFSQLYTIACENLFGQQVRTYSNGKLIGQFGLNGEGNIGVISNAWYPINNTQISAPVRKCEYETAIYLYEQESMRNILKLCSLPSSADTGNIVNILKEATGWDVTLPPPDKFGHQNITEEGLNSMNYKQLKVLYERTAGCEYHPKKSSREMVEEILRHHVEAQKHLPPVSKRKREEIDANVLKQTIQGPFSTNRTLLDFYSKHNGLIDNLSQFHYFIFHSSRYNTYLKLFFFSFINYLLFDSFVFYQEYIKEIELNSTGGTILAMELMQKTALTSFVMRVCEQIREENSSDRQEHRD